MKAGDRLMKHVFISYVRENSEEVQRLCDDLNKHGVNVWLDQRDVVPGVRWRKDIQKALMQVLGHDRLDTTELYLNPSSEDALQIQQQVRFGG